MKVIFTRKAKADLAGIREYYAERSERALQNIVSDILSVTDNLPSSIARGRKTENPLVWEKISPKYRYLIPYYSKGETIYVLRVYDPARRPLNYRTIMDLRV